MKISKVLWVSDMDIESLKQMIHFDFSCHPAVQSINFIGSINYSYYNSEFSDIDMILYLNDSIDVFDLKNIDEIKDLKHKFEKENKLKLGITLYSKKLMESGFINIKLLNNFIYNSDSGVNIDGSMIVLAESYYSICKNIMEDTVIKESRRVLKCFMHISRIYIKMMSIKNDNLLNLILLQLKKGEDLNWEQFNQYYLYIVEKILLVLERSDKLEYHGV